MADNLIVRDGNGNLKTLKYTDVGGILVSHSIIDDMPGVYAEGTAGEAGDGLVLAGAIQRASATSLETSPGTRVRLIVDGNGQLFVTLGTQQVTVAPTGSFPVQAYIQGDAIYDGLTALPVKFKQGEVPGNSTNATILAAVTSKKIRVVALSENVGDAKTTVTWLSGSGGTTLSKHRWDSNGGRSLSGFAPGYFQTASGVGLFMTTSGDITYYDIAYVEVP